jgi:hypothetical protein
MVDRNPVGRGRLGSADVQLADRHVRAVATAQALGALTVGAAPIHSSESPGPAQVWSVVNVRQVLLFVRVSIHTVALRRSIDTVTFDPAQ